MSPPFAPSLEALFLMLRTAGIPVGIEEIARLATIFSLTPVLDREGLQRVLATTLVKSTDQRVDFDRTFEKWLDTLDGELGRIEPLMDAELSKQRADRKRAPGEASAKLSLAGSERKSLARPAGPTLADIAAMQVSGAARGDRSAVDSLDGDDELFDPVEIPGPPTEQPGPSVSALAQGGDRQPPVRPESKQIPSDQSMHKSGTYRRLLALIMLFFTLGVAVWVLLIRGDAADERQSSPTEMADAGPNGATPDAGLVIAESKDSTFRPRLRIERAPIPESNLLGYIIAPLALALIFWLWSRFGGASWLPQTSSQPSKGDDDGASGGRGPPRRRSLETLMLDERDEEELIWGVGRFISEERSRDLDINRSVRDTASAFGRPVLHYQGSEFQREVWLWVDESLDSPVARQLADDLALMLQKSGLPVTRATFWGIPERLRSERDEAVTLDAFDARRNSAAVAILTDGRMLSLAHRARNRRGDIENLMRNLSFWPRITFIDFGADRLTPLCQRHGLRVIKPQDAASAISEFTDAYERPTEYGGVAGDARVWLAACALAPRALPERVALAVRRELALNVSPWQIARLRAHARDDAGRMGFSVAQRAAHLAWLIDAEDVPTRGDRLPDKSLLRRIVQAWERVLRERERTLARATEKRGRVWPGCAEERALAVERACIQLWAHPDRASRRLRSLYYADKHGARTAIRRYLCHLSGRERQGDEQTVALPWSLANMRRSTRVVLHDMGLSSAVAEPARHSMPAPGHIWLAVGLCAGLFAGAMTALIEQWTPPSKPPPVFVDEGYRDTEAPKNAFLRIDEDNLMAEIAMPGMAPVQRSVQRGDKVSIDWSRDERPCTESVGRALLMHCPHNPELNDRTNWSFAIFTGGSSRNTWRIAEELLASGSVDGVYLVDSAAEIADIPIDQLARPDQTGARDQLLVVAEHPPAMLGAYPGDLLAINTVQLGQLSGVTDDFRDWRTLASVRPRLESMTGSTQSFRVRGTGPCGGLGQRCCTGPEEACSAQLQCREQKCVQPECMLPGSLCEGDVAVTCTEDLTLERQQCQPSEVCDLGTCVPRRCEPDELTCLRNGTQYKSCLGGGRAWSEPRECARGDLCTSADGCQPIAGATVQFVSVRHRQRKRKRANIGYRLRCDAVAPGATPGLDIELTSSDPVVKLKNRPRVRVTYAISPKNLVIECRMSDIRVGLPDTATSLKSLPKTRVSMGRKSKRHSWTLAMENKLHRLTLSKFGDRNSITVEYRIKLRMDQRAGSRPKSQNSQNAAEQ